jgi:FG-GAP repeat.
MARMRRGRLAAAIPLAVAMACSGGSEGGSTPVPTQPGPVPAPPTLQISLGAPKAFVGDSVTLTWTAQQAASCAASGAWSGAQNTAGNVRLAFATGGVRSFVLACTGAGGSVTDSARLIVPLPVFATSYANAKNIETPVGPIPNLSPAVCRTNDARAYADFLQEGTLSRFVHGTVYDSITPGTLCLQRRAANGSWVDVSDQYISDRRGCLHPRKAIVADFNRDGKPDVFTACHGWDRSPYTGEKSILLMSNAQGRFDRIELPVVAFAHGAAAADVNGDGYPDILLLDSSHRTYVLHKSARNGRVCAGRLALAGGVPLTHSVLHYRADRCRWRRRGRRADRRIRLERRERCSCDFPSRIAKWNFHVIRTGDMAGRNRLSYHARLCSSRRFRLSPPGVLKLQRLCNQQSRPRNGVQLAVV